VQQAQKKKKDSSQSPSDKEPRLIEIITEEEETAKISKSNNINELRDKVELLQEELRRLKRK
ncbi:MAG: hypothetical protein ACQZ3N_09785, partial [cyanobacterium endosymbiont of Rhopalodia yunnanensis]